MAEDDTIRINLKNSATESSTSLRTPMARLERSVRDATRTQAEVRLAARKARASSSTRMRAVTSAPLAKVSEKT